MPGGSDEATDSDDSDEMIDSDTSEESEWRFTLDEIEQRQDDEPETTEVAGENGDIQQAVTRHDEPATAGHEDTNVAGSLDTEEPLEPEQIELENAAFVLVGVALVVGVILAAFLGL